MSRIWDMRFCQTTTGVRESTNLPKSPKIPKLNSENHQGKRPESEQSNGIHRPLPGCPYSLRIPVRDDRAHPAQRHQHPRQPPRGTADALHRPRRTSMARLYRHSRTHVVTASMDHIDFIAPVHVGDLLILKSTMNRVFTTSMEVGVKVWVENTIAGTHRHVASAYLTFVAVDSQGRSVPVSKLQPGNRRRNPPLRRRQPPPQKPQARTRTPHRAQSRPQPPRHVRRKGIVGGSVGLVPRLGARKRKGLMPGSSPRQFPVCWQPETRRSMSALACSPQRESSYQ